MAKRVFQVIDHCSIFLLIAGTYTPITLGPLREYNTFLGWLIFSIVWAAAIVGIVFNGINVKKYKVMSMICYIAMGWVIVFVFPEFMRSVDFKCVILMLIGGIVYTIGAVIYGFGKKARYIHSIWHFFVLAGSMLHFFAVYLYVL